PFGEELGAGTGGRATPCFGNATYPASGPDLVNQKFTGKERDAETGLDWFDSRYFSGAQGRFTSPDLPVMDQHINDPQSWNLYAYGRNNPLAYIDPTGREIELIGDEDESKKALELLKHSIATQAATHLFIDERKQG